MTLPGIQTISNDNPPASGTDSDTGTLFLIGISERGPVGVPKLARNVSQHIRAFGQETNYSTATAGLDAAFRDGLQKVYFSRVVGPSAAASSVTAKDASNADSLTFTAAGPGVYGDNLEVVVSASGSSFSLVVKESGVTVASSPSFASNADAVAWAQDYLIITDEGGDNPLAATNALSGGDDDRANITDSSKVAALAAFPKDLGPGQVSAGGFTTAVVQAALLDHALANNRFALIDLPDTGVVGSLASAAATLRALGSADHGMAFAPWAVVPGRTPGQTRTVPYSLIQAGLIARAASDGATPNEPVAGELGVSQYALGLSQPAWSAEDRETLNDAGVNVVRMYSGAVRTYGYRTLVDPEGDPTWLLASNARLRMEILAKAEVIEESFFAKQLDGKRLTISAYGGALTGALVPYWRKGALYGDSPEEAFIVDVGEQVNTDVTIAARQLNAVLKLRMSPFAEMVVLEMSKVPTTEVL